MKNSFIIMALIMASIFAEKMDAPTESVVTKPPVAAPEVPTSAEQAILASVAQLTKEEFDLIR